ncbi:AAA family ATPase [Sphingomonas hankookensis]
MSSAAIDTYADMYPVAARLLNFVETVSRGRVLYFPTYRRVERDLRELLEDDDPFATSDEINITPEIVDRFTSSGEVVGFGGQDISALLKDTATRIGVEARQVLNDHSVRFFEVLSTERSDQTKRARDLVRSVSKSHALLDRIAAFSDIPIDRKVVEDTLQAIREKLSKAKPGRPTQPQEMMLLYIGEMITLLEKIDSLSSPLQNFANLINRYLRPVKTAFLRASDNKVVILDRSSNEIEPDMLSSGEKQILSMFAFLLLKKSFTARFIIIDEPELSLSVSWQKTLIADLLLAAGSTYLVSATHSPYIFQHFNPKNVKSLGQL